MNASRAGDHTYSRFEAAGAAERGLARRLRGWAVGAGEIHDVEFRLDVAGAAAWVSLRLTGAAFRFRGHARPSAPGALRPSAAHGLVWLTRPAAGDVFLDPFCGTGTLAAERAVYPHARVLACDRDEALLAPAAHGVFGADARALPLPSGGVDAVATNLPFGHQVLTPRGVAGPVLCVPPRARTRAARRWTRGAAGERRAARTGDPAAGVGAGVFTERQRTGPCTGPVARGSKPPSLRVGWWRSEEAPAAAPGLLDAPAPAGSVWRALALPEDGTGLETRRG